MISAETLCAIYTFVFHFRSLARIPIRLADHRSQPLSVSPQWQCQRQRRRRVDNPVANAAILLDLNKNDKPSRQPIVRPLHQPLGNVGRRFRSFLPLSSLARTMMRRDTAERSIVISALADCRAFAAFSHQELDDLLSSFKIKEWGHGDVITAEGEPGSTFYVLAKGICDVTVDGMRVRVCVFACTRLFVLLVCWFVNTTFGWQWQWQWLKHAKSNCDMRP